MYDDDDDINIDDNQNQQQHQQTPPDGDTPPPTPPAPNVDHAAIAQTVAQTMAQFQQQQTAAQPRQYTQQELAEHFQVWNPDESFVNELNALNDPDAPVEKKLGVLHNLRDGIMQQAFRAAQLYVGQQMEQFQTKMSPALQLAQDRQNKMLMGEFHNKYPALKGQEELVDSITARLSAQGFKPKSKDEAFEKVAQVAESVLKKANPSFVLKPSGGNNGMPPMAGTNMGGFGAGSAGGAGRNTTGKSRGGLAKIFQ